MTVHEDRPVFACLAEKPIELSLHARGDDYCARLRSVIDDGHGGIESIRATQCNLRTTFRKTGVFHSPSIKGERSGSYPNHSPASPRRARQQPNPPGNVLNIMINFPNQLGRWISLFVMTVIPLTTVILVLLLNTIGGPNRIMNL